jgi:hypothetical protein
MSQDNVKIVYRIYGALNRNELEAADARVSPAKRRRVLDERRRLTSR